MITKHGLQFVHEVMKSRLSFGALLERRIVGFMMSQGLVLFAASKSNGYEVDILKLYFQAVAIANIADNAASSPATNIFVGLHTADPGETGSNSNETAYTGYARQQVARTTGGWSVTSGDPSFASPVANIDFGICTASPGAAITHATVARTNVATADYVATVTPNISMAVNVIPRLTTATKFTED
jgi:hypothetical protein